jgi:hypothetical protein
MLAIIEVYTVISKLSHRCVFFGSVRRGLNSELGFEWQRLSINCNGRGGLKKNRFYIENLGVKLGALAFKCYPEPALR